MQTQEQLEVVTVFKAKNESSGPLQQIAAAAEKVKTNTEGAQQALRNMPSMPGTGAGGPAGGGAGHVPAASSVEQQRFREEREEMLLMRKRRRSVMLQDHESHTAHRAAMTATMFLAAEGNSFASHLAKGGVAIQMVGSELAAMGGKSGELGMKMAKMAGNATAMIGAWEVGSAIGEKFNEAAEGAMHSFKHMGARGEELEKAFINYVPVLGTLYDMATREAREAEAVTKGNEAYARAQGYATAAHYAAAQEIRKHATREQELDVVTQKTAMALGAMPADKTGEAMLTFTNAALLAAEKIAKPWEKLEDVQARLMKAAEHTTASMIERKNKEDQTNMVLEREAKIMREMALPLHASLEKQQQYNAVIGSHIQALVSSGKLTADEAEASMNLLQAKIEAHGSVKNTIQSLREEENASILMANAVHEKVKHLHVIPVHATSEAMIKFNEVLLKTALDVAQGMGKAADPEFVKKIFEELKTASTEKQKKVYDFRNSRFDIKQNFAEGFDPGRVAVAFANDLSSLGERKTMSNYGPPSVVR